MTSSLQATGSKIGILKRQYSAGISQESLSITSSSMCLFSVRLLLREHFCAAATLCLLMLQLLVLTLQLLQRRRPSVCPNHTSSSRPSSAASSSPAASRMPRTLALAARPRSAA